MPSIEFADYASHFFSHHFFLIIFPCARCEKREVDTALRRYPNPMNIFFSVRCTNSPYLFLKISMFS